MIKNRKIELVNNERHVFCELSFPRGVKRFYRDATQKGYTGSYFHEDDIFLALYPTECGPFTFYEGKEFPITRDLTITIERDEKSRIFRITEYDIEIHYEERERGLGWWDQEESDVDLLVYMAENYQTDKFYELFTKQQDAPEK